MTFFFLETRVMKAVWKESNYPSQSESKVPHEQTVITEYIK